MTTFLNLQRRIDRLLEQLQAERHQGKNRIIFYNPDTGKMIGDLPVGSRAVLALPMKDKGDN